MREIGEIHFETDGEVENREFIERYVLDAVDRLPQLEFCDRVAFMPFTHEAVDEGNVWITIAGDVRTVVEHESKRWDIFVEEGLVSAWDVTDATEGWYEISGVDGGELLLRLHHVANQTTKAVFEECNELPAPVGSYPDEESKHPIGWSMMLHIATAHQEYSFEETMEAFLYGIQLTAEDISTFESPENAVQHVDECIQTLETIRDEIGE